MVSKFIKCIPLFVVFVIANFIFINNVSADQISCTYTGKLDNSEDAIAYSFSVGLDDTGNLFIKDVKFTNLPSGNVQNKISAENKMNSSDFSQDNELVTKCPDVYATIVSEEIHRNGIFVQRTSKLYVGATKEAVNVDITNGEEKLDNDRVKKIVVRDATLQTLSIQSFNRGDNFYLDGKVVNETKPKICEYKSVPVSNEDTSSEVALILKTANGKSWVQGIGNIVSLNEQGQFSESSCVKYLYTDCEKSVCKVSINTGSTIYVNEVKLETIGDPTLDGSFLGKIDGCEMLGSLGVLASEVFKILQVIAICLLIVMGMKDFAAALPSGDNNAISKAFKSFVKRIAIIIILFLLPVLINWLLDQISLANNCIIEIAK